MSTEEIIPLTKKMVPTIVGFDVRSNTYTIGDDAKLASLQGKGQTAVFNFKPVFGTGEAEFSKKQFWFSYALEERFGPKEKTYTDVLSAKEAALRFLQGLFSDIRLPEKVIVGEPELGDSWRDNFRRHVREVFSEIGISEVSFFSEPFAVFQYYRHIAGVFPVARMAETVLIIDIGGGTFNSCIIRTTEQGLLARGGALSVPIGRQAGLFGGAEIDKELLKILVNKTKMKGMVWKDEPLNRIEKRSSALLRIEEAKIRLSNDISHNNNLRFTDDLSKISTQIFLRKEEFHPESDIQEMLTGEDLKSVINQMWRRHYCEIIANTINNAEERLKASKIALERIDKVLVAGGSSRLPFMKELIHATLQTKVNKDNIFIGSDTGEAVAYGIACECREQIKRDPKLSTGKMASFTSNPLYIGFRQTRRDAIQIPKIKHKNTYLEDGQLLSVPFETEELIIKYEIELPFNLSDKLSYVFSDVPFQDNEYPKPMNAPNDMVSVPKLSKLSRKLELYLEIKPAGNIKPIFWFHGKGNSVSKQGQEVRCPEFYYDDFKIAEGKEYIGFDFGNSNSYIVRFCSIPQEITATEYPEFIISNQLKQRLREMEIKIEELRDKGSINKEELIDHAKKQAIEIIFHSNKIEGNPLTKGETETVLLRTNQNLLSQEEKEAKNLEAAYNWMLQNYQQCFEQPENFIRKLNGMILQDIAPSGQYRTGPVSLSGVDFVPPQSSSVPVFMQMLGEEIKSCGPDRSPIEFATSLHTKLVWVHPFSDGNGRTARLLLNACLLAQGLPVIIVNYADRERYLHCLCESNKGDLSPAIEFFIECLEQQFEDFATGTELMPSEELTDIVVPTVLIPTEPEIDAIAQAINEISDTETESDDPLALVMEEKIQEYFNIRQVEYEAWKQGFISVAAEFRAIIESFNANDRYAKVGFNIKLLEYDMLPFEKYDEISVGKRVTRTWFIGLEISKYPLHEKVVLFFNRTSPSILRNSNASKVSLAISRFNGSHFQRLDTEPIGLREICYQDGELIFLSREGSLPTEGVRKTLKQFLSDIIRSYL